MAGRVLGFVLICFDWLVALTEVCYFAVLESCVCVRMSCMVLM